MNKVPYPLPPRGAAFKKPEASAAQAAAADRPGEKRSRLDKLRILPVLMVVATLMFGVKIGDIWNNADAIVAGIPAAQAEEETQPSAPASTEHEGEQPAAADAGKAATAAEGETAAAETSTDKRDWDSSEPYSQGELQLLENLADRRKELDERTRELDMRERVLTAMEKRIDDKIAEMKKIEAQVASYLKNYDEQHIENLKSLVKMYETMKPKDAARIFEQLHMDILVDVASHMKENKLAAVMAAMSPDSAKALTVELATKKPIPLASN